MPLTPDSKTPASGLEMRRSAIDGTPYLTLKGTPPAGIQAREHTIEIDFGYQRHRYVRLAAGWVRHMSDLQGNRIGHATGVEADDVICALAMAGVTGKPIRIPAVSE